MIGFRILDELDLSSIDSRINLTFANCHFSNAPQFDGAKLASLTLINCSLPGIELVGTRIEGDLTLYDCELFAGINGTNARVTGTTRLLRLEIHNLGDDSIDFDGARFESELEIIETGSSGSVSLRNIQVQGGLFARELRSTGFGNAAVDIQGSTVHGSVRFLDCRFDGEMNGMGSNIAGQLTLGGLIVRSPSGTSLTFDTATVGADIFVTDCDLQGEARFRDVRVGGVFSFEKTEINASYSTSLRIDDIKTSSDLDIKDCNFLGRLSGINSQIGGDVLLQDVSVSESAGFSVLFNRLVGANQVRMKACDLDLGLEMRALDIGGQLIFDEVNVQKAERVALRVDGSTIKGDFVLSSFSTDRPVSLLGILTSGQLQILGSRFDGDIALDHSRLTGSLIVRTSTFGGLAKLDGVTIAGQLQLLDFHSTAAARSLSGEQLEVRGGAFLQLKGDGVVSLSKAKLQGQTVFQTTSSIKGQMVEVDLEGAEIEWLTAVPANDGTPLSSFDMTRTKVQRLDLGEGSEFALAAAGGIELGTVHGTFARAPKSVRDLLARMDQESEDGHLSQPWLEFARAVENSGEPQHARWIRAQAAHRATLRASWVSKILVRWPYGAIVGYGYYPLRTLAWLAAIFALSLYLSSSYAEFFQLVRSDLTPADAPTQVVFDPVLYAIDVAVPAANTGEYAQWHVRDISWLPAVFGALRSASWLLAALLLAGLTGLLRRHQ